MTKRIFAALLLLAVLLTACQTESTPSGTSSGTTSQPADVSGDTPMEESQRIQKLDAMYGEPLNRTGMERYSISQGKPVTASREAEGALSLLTDDKYVENNNTASSVHFSDKVEIAVTLDMGETVENVADMGISLYANMSKNASLPKYIEFYVSDDGSSYLLVGTVYRSPDAVLNQSNLFLLSLQGKISFRYLKAVIPEESFLSTETYIDEICVYDYKEKESGGNDLLLDNYYINEPLPEVTEKEYWASSEADYTKEQNLVLNKSFRVMCPCWIDGVYVQEYYNTQPSAGLLTDGKTGSSSFTDSAYFHFTHMLERTVIFDLEKVSGVSSVSVGILKSTPEGLDLPNYVRVLGSMDGKVWGELAQGVPSMPGDYVRTEFALTFEKTAARFIAVVLEVHGHMWVDEITVNGTKSVEGAVEKEFVQPEDPYENAFLPTDALGGAENILLTYTYRAENPQAGLNTPEELLPYVAYLDEDGNIKDTFFDAFLFLPSGQQFPSGGHLYYDPKNPSRIIDWTAVEDNFFAPGYNIDALNEATRRMDEALGTDTDMPVYLSIFSTVYGDKGFGDVDGDGVSEDFTSLDDRKKVITWWIDRLEARFAAGEYDHLKLHGFYWNHEEMERSDPQEKELIRFTADYLHAKGYYFIWIPYYMAPGFNQWKTYGFDAAVMQPNYMFKDDVDESRLYYNAELTYKVGLGVEIEADYGVTNNAEKREKYMAYLRAGVETGYMHSIKMYYQDAGPGVFYNACYATDSMYRQVYDATYQYAKGTLSFRMGTIVETTFTGKKDQQLTIFPKGEDGKLVECALAEAPKYGSVQMSNNGRFYYYPAEGFTGTDTFVVGDPNNPDSPGTVITVIIE